MPRQSVTKRQITIEMPAQMFEGIQVYAKTIGQRPHQYARMLLEAAYAVRCKKIEDVDLDTMIGIIMVLESRLPTSQIAKGMGVSEDLVVTIIKAWKNTVIGQQ